MTVKKLTLNQILLIISLVISILALFNTQNVKVDLTADIDNLKSDFATIKELQTNSIQFIDDNGDDSPFSIDYNGTTLRMGGKRD